MKLSGRVAAERKDFVAWIYADPVGPEHNTLNCSISDLVLESSSTGPGRAAYRQRRRRLRVRHRDTDHGIPVQPYPDG